METWFCSSGCSPHYLGLALKKKMSEVERKKNKKIGSGGLCHLKRVVISTADKIYRFFFLAATR